jgi:hypothetical protein
MGRRRMKRKFTLSLQRGSSSGLEIGKSFFGEFVEQNKESFIEIVTLKIAGQH